jgi:hypothetical protein
METNPWDASRWGEPAGADRDDRIYPVTRWIARVIIPFLAAAFLVLWVVPDRTTEFFAWTIRPEMTPVVMGAGYGAGVYFFYRVSTGTEWHRVTPVFLGITTFTWAMAVATVLHWGQFNHGHHTFALWVVLYAVTPVVVPGVWVFNRRTDPGHAATGGPLLPPVVRICGGVLSLAVTVSAAVLFAVPDLMIGSWPWTVSPLTARILAGWFLLFGVVDGAVVRDGRWRATRILLQSQFVGFGLVLVGAVRFWGNFDRSNTLTWLVVGGMALYLFAVLTLYAWMERR